MLLEGKVAIVTGAARGTGKAIARRFVAEGATVALADVLVEQGEATAAKLGPTASFHELDVTDADGWAALVEGLVAAHGHVDVLVNNAAILHLGSIEATGLDTFRRVLDVNAAGAYAGIAAVVPTMRANGGGSIVNIASIDGLQAMNGLSAYATSKWAMRGLTKAAAVELGRDGIGSTPSAPPAATPPCTGPGPRSWPTSGPPSAPTWRSGPSHARPPPTRSPRSRSFLASDLSTMVTGADVPIDGGHTAGDHVAGFGVSG